MYRRHLEFARWPLMSIQFLIGLTYAHASGFKQRFSYHDNMLLLLY